MRISDWSSDVCSSDLDRTGELHGHAVAALRYDRYHSTVSVRASSTDLVGAQPRTLRALEAERHWLSISWVAVARISGSRSVPAARCRAATSSSTASGVSVAKLTASPTNSGS